MIRPVGNREELLEALERVRRAGGAPITNWFANLKQVDRWVAGKTLAYLERSGALLIFRRDRDFLHIYYWASDAEVLAAALATLGDAGVAPTIFTVDILGRPEDVGKLAAIYQSFGFTRHASLTRMVRLTSAEDSELPEDPDVTFGVPADQLQIQEFLNGLLDRFRDRIPDSAELAELLSQGKVLLVRRGTDVGGALFFDAKGLTSHLRYWYVNPGFRDRGIGARLMKTYFRLSGGGKRVILWVVSDNTDAIDKYQHYGFRPEALVDWIMIKGLDG